MNLNPHDQAPVTIIRGLATERSVLPAWVMLFMFFHEFVIKIDGCRSPVPSPERVKTAPENLGCKAVVC